MAKRVTLSLSMLPIHRQALDRIAGQDGEGLSVILRRLIREEAKARGIWPESELADKGDGEQEEQNPNGKTHSRHRILG